MYIICKQIFVYTIIFNLFFTSPTLSIFSDDTRLVICEDGTADLREFDGTWFKGEICKDWLSMDDENDLSHDYSKIIRYWNDIVTTDDLYNPQTDGDTNPENYENYNDFKHIDFFKIELRDVDKSIVTLYIKTKGDAETSDLPWVFYIWSEGGKTDIIFKGTHTPDPINDEDLSGYKIYDYEKGSELDKGNLDFSDSGTDILIEFEKKIYNEFKDGDLYGIIISVKTDNYNEKTVDLIIDLFPHSDYNIMTDPWFWFWMLVSFILIIISIVLLYLLVWKNKNRKKVRKIIRGKK